MYEYIVDKFLDDLWMRGRILTEYGDYEFTAKVYDEGSGYGINNGRVSKLELKDFEGNIVVNYDRGWDIYPSDNGFVLDVLEGVVGFLEEAPKIK